MAFEKVLAGGSVIDGTGGAAYRADVAVADGRIAAVGDLAAAARAETIDATGQVVCPGFIDMHAHSDVSMLDDPGGECKAYQGVTTEVVGNCGSSAFPAGLLTPAELQAIAPLHVVEGSTVRYGWSDFDGWATALEQSGISLNVVGQIGHSTLRQAAKATEARPANDEELAVMKRLVAEAVEQGAVALTTQLTGPPAAAAPASEIAALAAEALRFPGAFYATHARLHNGNHFNAVDEAIEIGELTGIPVQYSHIALIDTRRHGEGGQMVRRMEVARERGVDVLYDVYPYTAGACGITLDTHAAVWWTQQPGELSSAAAEALEAADQILVPSIVFWELALLVRKQRLRLGHGQPVGSWVRQVLAIPRVREVPIDHRIALASDAADMHPDPADRLIATTAMAFDAPLISKDHRMRDLGWLNTIW